MADRIISVFVGLTILALLITITACAAAPGNVGEVQSTIADTTAEMTAETVAETTIPPEDVPPETPVVVNTEPETAETTEAIVYQPETANAPTVSYIEPETVPTTSAVCADGYIGTFKVCGYCKDCNGGYGTRSASGMSLIAGQSCAMNLGDMRRLGLSYGDWITIDGFGDRQIVDCGCSSGTLDLYCAVHGEEYAITSYRDAWYY